MDLQPNGYQWTRWQESWGRWDKDGLGAVLQWELKWIFRELYHICPHSLSQSSWPIPTEVQHLWCLQKDVWQPKTVWFVLLLKQTFLIKSLAILQFLSVFYNVFPQYRFLGYHRLKITWHLVSVKSCFKSTYFSPYDCSGVGSATVIPVGNATFLENSSLWHQREMEQKQQVGAHWFPTDLPHYILFFCFFPYVPPPLHISLPAVGSQISKGPLVSFPLQKRS